MFNWHKISEMQKLARIKVLINFIKSVQRKGHIILICVVITLISIEYTNNTETQPVDFVETIEYTVDSVHRKYAELYPVNGTTSLPSHYCRKLITIETSTCNEFFQMCLEPWLRPPSSKPCFIHGKPANTTKKLVKMFGCISISMTDLKTAAKQAKLSTVPPTHQEVHWYQVENTDPSDPEDILQQLKYLKLENVLQVSVVLNPSSTTTSRVKDIYTKAIAELTALRFVPISYPVLSPPGKTSLQAPTHRLFVNTDKRRLEEILTSKFQIEL